MATPEAGHRLRSSRERVTTTSRDVLGGCFVCKADGMAIWRGGNAQGVAARHHDATGHQTWCDVAMSIRYGNGAEMPEGR